MVTVNRSPHVLLPDSSRVLALPFFPGEANFGGDRFRVDLIIERIQALSDEEVDREVDRVAASFAGRHRDIEATWERHAERAADVAPAVDDLSPNRRRLAGMAFTQEYAFESTAVCNPSIASVGEEAPDGTLEFVMTVRSIGEGHLSSISFRTGRVSADGKVELDEVSPWAQHGTRRSGRFDSSIFRTRLQEMRVDNDLSNRVLDDLGPEFTLEDLEIALARLAESDVPAALRFETERAMHWLAASNYEVQFGDIPISERVLSPAAPVESRGMEDARLVRFVDDDGSERYYATYTAYDGFEALPQLIETTDFQSFKVATLTGACARSKGIALFPRKIQGDYVALARTDNESTFVMRSDHVRRWEVAELVLRPSEPWELIQAGNSGSPLETPEGWLVIMHGVGPMREYVLSAVLLDLEEPTKLVARMREPLLVPEDPERNGYVPNVVYSCGALLHGDVLVVPYGFADYGVRIATMSLSDVLDAMD